jgi:hypothetical protein
VKEAEEMASFKVSKRGKRTKTPDDEGFEAPPYEGETFIDPDALIEPNVEVIIDDDDVNNIGKLSYKQVKEHQRRMHPRDPESK